MSETLMYAYDKITNKTYRVGYIDFAKQKCQLAYLHEGQCYVTYDRKLKDVMLLKDDVAVNLNTW